ncbi:ATPase AAA [Desulfosarcina ovata subsp. sediminis]|uniref:ATPase AAA n=1 Tax=Desulfosarcina ovata subsp. sediminis TaxID=885957 RepID=A0A5K7ZZK5_9BACT|nr:MoxR family ATPase [Desulfosarcina ovata]BBO85682.1 ATPase AAA [Desulfosarcina ovata subsp. sediminis]
MTNYYTGDSNWPEIGATLDLAPPISKVFEAPMDYLPASGLVAAVNAALMLGQPLILTGEPGTGKTQLAYHVARRLGLLRPIKFEVKSTTESRDLFYTVDSIRQFRDYSVKKDGDLDPLDYIEFQSLGLAILRAAEAESHSIPREKFDHRPRADLWPEDPATIPMPHRSVVLIDEIDKAPRDVPNDLLNELEHLYFRIPELSHHHQVAGPITARSDLRPIVIFTSNSEKNLPAAFLRRCVFYNIEFPDREELQKIVEARMANLPMLRPLIQDVLTFVTDHLRNGPRALDDKPGTAEVLSFLLALHRMDVGEREGLKACCEAAMNAVGTLAKNDKDLKKVQSQLKHYCGA